MVKGRATPIDTEGNGKASGERKPRKSIVIEDSSPVKRSYLKQADAPTTSLEDALRLPQAIFDHYAGKPTVPFNVAKALNVDPKGSQLRLLSGAAIAFGLIEGGAQASAISVTDLARRIIRPRAEGENLKAKREAVLRPRIFGEFLKMYDGNVFPRRDLAINILEEMGVPRDKADEIIDRISESARSVGLIEDIKGKYYVRIDAGEIITNSSSEAQEAPVWIGEEPQPSRSSEANSQSDARVSAPPIPAPTRGAAMVAAVADDQRRRRVFITHGKDRALVDPIKKIT